jgi:hypothetical protein
MTMPSLASISRSGHRRRRAIKQVPCNRLHSVIILRHKTFERSRARFAVEVLNP